MKSLKVFKVRNESEKIFKSFLIDMIIIKIEI